jgi:hypothetical protein
MFWCKVLIPFSGLKSKTSQQQATLNCIPEDGKGNMPVLNLVSREE